MQLKKIEREKERKSDSNFLLAVWSQAKLIKKIPTKKQNKRETENSGLASEILMRIKFQIIFKQIFFAAAYVETEARNK